jgi:hypothetical protein
MFGGTGERLSLPKNLLRGDGVLEDSLLAGQTLIRLSEACAVNEELAEVCDTYDVMDERHLLVAFGLSAAG